jgi:hypothetical protein
MKKNILIIIFFLSAMSLVTPLVLADDENEVAEIPLHQK